MKISKLSLIIIPIKGFWTALRVVILLVVTFPVICLSVVFGNFENIDYYNLLIVFNSAWYVILMKKS